MEDEIKLVHGPAGQVAYELGKEPGVPQVGIVQSRKSGEVAVMLDLNAPKVFLRPGGARMLAKILELAANEAEKEDKKGNSNGNEHAPANG